MQLTQKTHYHSQVNNKPMHAVVHVYWATYFSGRTSTFTASPHSNHCCPYWTFSKSMSINVNVQTVKPFSTTQKPPPKPSPVYYSSIVLTFDTHCIVCGQQLHPAREMLSIAGDVSLMCESLARHSQNKPKLQSETDDWQGGLTLFQCAKLLKMSIKNWRIALQQLNAFIRKSTRYVS